MKKEFTFRLVMVCIIVLLMYQFGVNPMLNKSSSKDEWAKDKITRQKGQYDVIVFGEEAEGIAAAVSAARSGAKTLLISEDKNLGGVVSKCLLVDLEPSFDPQGTLLNKGFYGEIYRRLGKNFSSDKYISTMENIISKEENIEVLYNAGFQSPILHDNVLKGVNIEINKQKRALYGQMFIDATREGKLLSACGVPRFNGSEDLNMKDSFSPARLNFIVEGITPTQIEEALKSEDFYRVLGKFEPSFVNVDIRNFSVSPQSNESAIIQGIEVSDVNVEDKQALNKAYQNAVKEAQHLTTYLKKKYTGFEGIKFVTSADSFYIREWSHFIGEYVLSVNDVLENRDFDDKIAMGSRAVDASKFTKEGSYIIGKPEQYTIPLGCIVPIKIDNLLMVGKKSSYSSLASSSAGVLSVSVTTGESAGIISVFSIVENISARQLTRQRNMKRDLQMQELLKKQGVYLPQYTVEGKNSVGWSYPYLKQLVHLGLVAGGQNNDFKPLLQASREELAVLILNGVYRLAPEKYSLEFDSRLRKHFIKDGLTKDKAGEVLLSIYGIETNTGQAYKVACEKGYIDSVTQLRLKDAKELKLEDVYYLAYYNIKKYTGKNIIEQ